MRKAENLKHKFTKAVIFVNSIIVYNHYNSCIVGSDDESNTMSQCLFHIYSIVNWLKVTCMLDIKYLKPEFPFPIILLISKG